MQARQMADHREHVSFEEGGVTVDAALVARGLRLQASAIPSMLRDGLITCRFERGTREDEGRFRLTFWYSNLRFRVIVDDTGKMAQWMRLNYGGPRPTRSRT